jgi:hypothetical protein
LVKKVTAASSHEQLTKNLKAIKADLLKEKKLEWKEEDDRDPDLPPSTGEDLDASNINKSISVDLEKSMLDELEESMVEFNESVIVEKECRDNFETGELKQGVNLFGKCYQPKCRKKFVIKLGLGTFMIQRRKHQDEYFYPHIINDLLEKQRIIDV